MHGAIFTTEVAGPPKKRTRKGVTPGDKTKAERLTAMLLDLSGQDFKAQEVICIPLHLGRYIKIAVIPCRDLTFKTKCHQIKLIAFKINDFFLSWESCLEQSTLVFESQLGLGYSVRNSAFGCSAKNSPTSKFEAQTTLQATLVVSKLQ